MPKNPEWKNELVNIRLSTTFSESDEFEKRFRL